MRSTATLKQSYILLLINIAISFISALFSLNEQIRFGVYASYVALFVLIVNVYSVIFTIKKDVPANKYLKIFVVLIGFNTLAHILGSGIGVINISGLVQILGPVVAYYVSLRFFSLPNQDSENLLKGFIILFIAFLIIFSFYRFTSYFFYLKVALQATYFIVFTLPILLLLRGKLLLKYVAVLLTVFACFVSFKRGTVISAVAIAVVFFLSNFFGKDTKVKIVNLLLLVATLGVTYWYLSGENSDIEYMMLRISNMEEGDSSGRGDIYNLFIDQIKNFTIYEHLFGRGLKSTIFINNGLTAHSDWLEIYYDYGILVAFSWFLFIFGGIKRIFTSKTSSTVKTSIVCMMIAYITTSNISQVFFFGYFYIFMIFLGYYNSNINNRL